MLQTKIEIIDHELSFSSHFPRKKNIEITPQNVYFFFKLQLNLSCIPTYSGAESWSGWGE